MMHQPIRQAPATRPRARTQAWEDTRHPQRQLLPPAPVKRFPVDRLDCYRLAIELAALAATQVPRGHASLKDQLERATTSGVLNLAEGWGRYQPREKSHFYTIAHGSILESAAIVDLLRARGLAGDDECVRARDLARRVAQMLRGLIHGVGLRTTIGG
jgi:four helix bundle protein